MPIDPVQDLLSRFARGKLRRAGENGVALALVGRWGVGKTYLWSRVVREVASAGALGRQRYAYVSLFGLNSLDEVRAEIVVRQRTPDDLDPDLNDLPEVKMVRKAKERFAPLLRRLANHPVVTTALGPNVAEAIAFDLFGRDLMVCFDDLERAGPGIRLGDVFGLATQLRDERRCDVLFILNGDQLGDRKAEYLAHGEKAVDHRVQFRPTAESAFGVVMPEEDPLFGSSGLDRALVQEACEKLQITNLRVLQRIAWALRELAPYLDGRNDTTITETVRAAVLYVWGYHSAEGDVPPYERLKTAPESDIDFALLDDALYGDGPEQSEEEATRERALSKLWERYGPVGGGLVRLEIAAFVETGWLNGDRLPRLLDQEDAAEEKRSAQAALSNAWDPLFSGYGDNEAELVSGLETAMRTHGKYVSVENAGKTIRLIRDLGHEPLADELVDVYVGQHRRFLLHGSDRSLLRYRGVDDPVLEDRVREILATRNDRPSLVEAMADVGEGDSWGGTSTEVIETARVDDLEAYVKETEFEDQRDAVRWCLRGSPMEESNRQSIAGAMTEALLRIASSSRLNAWRVRTWYKVEIPGDPAPHPPNIPLA